MTKNHLSEQDRNWIRSEAQELLQGSHTTMLQVLLAQGVATGLFLGATTSIVPERFAFLVIALLVAMLSIGGISYSFQQLRHSRYLHNLMRVCPPGSSFLDIMHSDARRKRKQHWEETSCMIGYVLFPTLLLTAPAWTTTTQWGPAGQMTLAASIVIAAIVRARARGRCAADERDWKHLEREPPIGDEAA